MHFFFFFFFFSFFFFFETRFLCSFGACPETSSCRSGWPRTHRDPPASPSPVLGLKACVTTAGHIHVVLFREIKSIWVYGSFKMALQVQAPAANPVGPVFIPNTHMVEVNLILQVIYLMTSTRTLWRTGTQTQTYIHTDK